MLKREIDITGSAVAKRKSNSVVRAKESHETARRAQFTQHH